MTHDTKRKAINIISFLHFNNKKYSFKYKSKEKFKFLKNEISSIKLGKF